MDEAVRDDCAVLRISGIVDESIVDGPGLRYVVFTQGCPHRCPGCHNPQTHSFEGGTLKTVEEVFEAYQENPLLSGLTLSGGEPFCQAAALKDLAERVKALGHNVVTFTGYTYETLLHMAENDPATRGLLNATDLLIDGPYLEDMRDQTLKYRGSTNQRLILLSNAFKHSPDLEDELDKLYVLD